MEVVLDLHFQASEGVDKREVLAAKKKPSLARLGGKEVGYVDAGSQGNWRK